MAVSFWFFDVEGLLLHTAIAAAVHELGHVAMLYLAGGRIKRISAALCGFCIEYDGVVSTAWECVIILAGPAFNFFLAACCAGEYPTITGITIAQAVFNLLPVSGMDGGRLLSMAVHNSAVTVWTERICIVLICAVSVFSFYKGHASNLIVLAVWLFFDRVLAMAKIKSYNK